MRVINASIPALSVIWEDGQPEQEPCKRTFTWPISSSKE